MKKNQNSKTTAFSLVELVIILAVFAVFLVLGISVQARASAKSVRMNCASNLKQVALAFRIWEGNYGGRFPQSLMGQSSLPNTTAFYPVSGVPGSSQPYTYEAYMVMSNELNNPRVMVCPADERTAATNFTTDFSSSAASQNTRCSYFVGRDVTDSNPQMFLAGDRNLASSTADPIGNPPFGTYSQFGVTAPTKSEGWGVAIGTNPTTNNPFGWNAKIHRSAGNVALVDGSVQLLNNSTVKTALNTTGDTNSPGNVLLFP